MNGPLECRLVYCIDLVPRLCMGRPGVNMRAWPRDKTALTSWPSLTGSNITDRVHTPEQGVSRPINALSMLHTIHSCVSRGYHKRISGSDMIS